MEIPPFTSWLRKYNEDLQQIARQRSNFWHDTLGMAQAQHIWEWEHFKRDCLIEQLSDPRAAPGECSDARNDLAAVAQYMEVIDDSCVNQAMTKSPVPLIISPSNTITLERSEDSSETADEEDNTVIHTTSPVEPVNSATDQKTGESTVLAPTWYFSGRYRTQLPQ